MPSSRSRSRPTVPEQPTGWSFDAIGTAWWIGVYQPLSATALSELQQAVARRIEAFDRTYSRFRADSLVSQVARTAGRYTFPADAAALFGFYRQLYEVSEGAVTPLVGQVLSDAGYDAAYSFQPHALTRPPAWDDVLSFEGTELRTSQPVLLDFGAAGKGYLVDVLAGLLRKHGIGSFCVDAGGDLYCQGLRTPLRIGLEHPAAAGQVIGVASLQQGALCGSAVNRRAWSDYHHIFDPRSLQPVRGIQAVWTTAADAMTADGLTTMLFFMQHKQLVRHFAFASCIIYDDNTVERSAGFPAELFGQEN